MYPVKFLGFMDFFLILKKYFLILIYLLWHLQTTAGRELSNKLSRKFGMILNADGKIINNHSHLNKVGIFLNALNWKLVRL